MPQQHHLVVTQPFGDYKKGDRIRDASEIQSVYDRSLNAHVVRVAADSGDASAPAAEAKPAVS